MSSHPQEPTPPPRPPVVMARKAAVSTSVVRFPEEIRKHFENWIQETSKLGDSKVSCPQPSRGDRRS
jgi:hypothetical protein